MPRQTPDHSPRGRPGRASAGKILSSATTAFPPDVTRRYAAIHSSVSGTSYQRLSIRGLIVVRWLFTLSPSALAVVSDNGRISWEPCSVGCLILIGQV